MKRRNSIKIDYWQSMADVLSVLVLIFILLLMLLSMIWVVEQEEEKEQRGLGIDVDVGRPSSNPQRDNVRVPAGGGNEQNTPKENEDKEGDYKEKPIDNLKLEDEGLAAVTVRVIDGDTKKAIQTKGISLQLFTSANALKTLNGYYPEKRIYQSFETTEKGELYLPEKIELGEYYFKNIVAPKGYAIGEKVAFNVEKAYAWYAPYVVTFPLKPVTRTIRLLVTDSVTGEGVADGIFTIVAKKDIVTKDGTERFKQGDIVDTIKCDENGIAESKSLYLGTYEIRQKTPAKYYGSIEDIEEVEMDINDSTQEPKSLELEGEKTKVVVAVQDELEESTGALGAACILSKKNGEKVEKFQVEEDGTFAITNLAKEQSYQLMQVEWGENYVHNNQSIEFYVDDAGRIDGEVLKKLTIYNRKIRVKITTRGMLLKNNLAGYSMLLKDGQGNVIRRFKTNSEPTQIEGLEPGVYLLSAESLSMLELGSKEVKVVVKDEKNIQVFNYSIWTVRSTIVCAIVTFTLLGFVIVVIHNRRKREK